MTGDDVARRLDAALRASLSTDYRDRVAATEELALLAHEPVAANRLGDLVLDDDTAVTLAASTALIARDDDVGLVILATALPNADDQQRDWIESGIGDGLDVSEQARERALAAVSRLSANADPSLRRGAELLADIMRTAGRV